jgi:peptidoglycan/xylan/chitin deacetylase (PgdA/CDA1 family)
VVTHLENTDAVALTLDTCEGCTDLRIIGMLREHSIPVTLFVTNIWLRHNKKTAEELAADQLFTFACHGKRHKPASVDGKLAFAIRGTRSIPALVEEIEDNARTITALTGNALRSTVPEPLITMTWR